MIQSSSTSAALLGLALMMVSASATKSEANDAEASETVKVYILAGQSNMEGKAQNKLWEHQATDPKTKEFFAHLRNGDQWAVRDDVFIKFLGRSGPLTLGFGSPGRTGCDYVISPQRRRYANDPGRD